MMKYFWKVKETYVPKSQLETPEYGILNYDNNTIQDKFGNRDKIENIVQKHNETIVKLLEEILKKE